MQYFVSEGNSIGFYSNYHMINFETIKEAIEHGMDAWEGDFTVWHYEWDADRQENVPVSDY